MGKPKRILILGGSGAGKSTLAFELGQKFGLPIIHMDKLVWRSGWVMAQSEILEKDVEKVLAQESWVLDGSLRRHTARLVPAADLVIFLDYPGWLNLARVLKRILQSYRQVRSDMADGCPEQIDLQFFRWTWRWPKTHGPDVVLALALAKSSETFRRPAELRRWLNSI